MSANYFSKATIIDRVIDVEAGYVNHPSDRGGETNMGVTHKVANSPRVRPTLVAMGWNGNMRTLTKPMAIRVYELMYWNVMKLDSVHPIDSRLADKLFECGVNVGTTAVVSWLQRALNAFNRRARDYADLKVDGGMGPVTIAAINSYVKVRGKKNAINNLLRAIICQQGTHYLDISQSRPENEDFTNGWYNDRVPHNVREYDCF